MRRSLLATGVLIVLLLFSAVSAASEEAYIVKDIYPGEGSSACNWWSLTAFKGMLYFCANDGIHGEELWRSDGTPGGTHMVNRVSLGPAP